MDVLNSVANRTDNPLLLLVIVLLVGTVVGLPMYKAATKAREKKREQYLEQMQHQEKREERLMEVIQNNSTVISELSTIMKNNQMSCADCKMEQVILYKELNEKQELMNTTLEVIKNSLPRAI